MDINIIANIIVTILLIQLIILMVFGGIWAKNSEKKAYNNGICPHCQTELVNFDTDSQGGRGYKCNKCKYSTWVSYRVDKNHNKNHSVNKDYYDNN